MSTRRFSEGYPPGVGMEEDPNGEWVRWDAVAEAIAAERERIVAAVERLPDSVGGEPEWDGKFESGWVNRAVVLAIVRGTEP